MPPCVADNARMGFVNCVNFVNLSTNLKIPAANTNARVSDPVPIEHPLGPQCFSESRFDASPRSPLAGGTFQILNGWRKRVRNLKVDTKPVLLSLAVI